MNRTSIEIVAYKCTNTYIREVPEKEREKKRHKKHLNVGENFPNLMENTNLHLQEPYQASTRINKQTQKSTCGYFRANVMEKETILKAAREK